MFFTKESLNEDINEYSNEEASCKEDSLGIWTLEFDGSCSSSGSGVGIVLIPPQGEPEPLAFKLECRNTNNTAEYKALLLGIVVAKEKGVKILKARGDVELIVRKIREQYSVKNHRLKNYRNRV